eukprot:2963549-Rhodomonas_salina.1
MMHLRDLALAVHPSRVERPAGGHHDHRTAQRLQALTLLETVRGHVCRADDELHHVHAHALGAASRAAGGGAHVSAEDLIVCVIRVIVTWQGRNQSVHEQIRHAALLGHEDELQSHTLVRPLHDLVSVEQQAPDVLDGLWRRALQLNHGL